MTYCDCGDSGFGSCDSGSTGGCDFTQWAMAFPSLTSGMYPTRCFSVSTVLGRGSLAMSALDPAWGAGITTVMSGAAAVGATVSVTSLMPEA